MTAWDIRSFVRALAATLMAALVVWIVTAASDEGQLAAGVRAGRTLPLIPLCGAVGVALALGTARQKQEIHALEALGRSPTSSVSFAVLGATLPSLATAAFLSFASHADVSAFYPRAQRADTFAFHDGAFESASLGVRVEPDGTLRSIPMPEAEDETLPRHARGATGWSTALSGLALPLVTAGAVLTTTPYDARRRKRRRARAAATIAVTSLATVGLFQGAAVHVVPALAAVAPPAVLLALVVLGYRLGHGLAQGGR